MCKQRYAIYDANGEAIYRNLEIDGDGDYHWPRIGPAFSADHVAKQEWTVRPHDRGATWSDLDSQ